MPASAAIASSLRAQLSEVSVMVSSKCLAMRKRLMTRPTRKAISFSVRSGRRLRWVAAAILASSSSVAASNSPRLRARS
jgi:hypothetical protein